MEVLGLIKSKRACLARFLESTRAFAARVAAGGFAGDLAGLDAFERERDSALKALGLFERRLTQAVGELSAADRSPALAAQVQASLDEQAGLLAEILRLDAAILRDIESEQLRLVRELAAADRSKDLVSRFKSGAAPSAGLDQTI